MSSSLVPLFHHRWALPVLAELGAGSSRFVVLATRLGASREALRQALGALIDAGLVERNPGYGHPLRPEYLLTERGRAAAREAARLVAALRRLRLEEVGLKKWPLPALLELARGSSRFSELRANLPGITPRALTLALKDLGAAGLVERRVTTDYPPATFYRPLPRARALTAILERLRI